MFKVFYNVEDTLVEMTGMTGGLQESNNFSTVASENQGGYFRESKTSLSPYVGIWIHLPLRTFSGAYKVTQTMLKTLNRALRRMLQTPSFRHLHLGIFTWSWIPSYLPDRCSQNKHRIKPIHLTSSLQALAQNGRSNSGLLHCSAQLDSWAVRCPYKGENRIICFQGQFCQSDMDTNSEVSVT